MSNRILNFDELPRIVSPPDLCDEPRYKEAHEFKLTVEPDPTAEYDWVSDYARDIFDRGTKTFKELDDKANDIIKYLGGGAGLFTLAVLANITPQNVGTIALVIPAFLCSLASIFFAALARQPNLVVYPPSAKTAYDYASHYKDGKAAKAAFVGQWHLACEGIDLANELKADRVTWATWLFFATIALLLLPLMASLRHMA